MKRLQPVYCLPLIALLIATSSFAADDGFVALFDGKTLDKWDGDPKLWSVEDGMITGQTSDQDPIPHNTFLVYRGSEPGDFELRLKFRMFGGNSGVQFRSVEVDQWVISGYQGDFDASGKYVGILYEEKGRGILGRRGYKTVIGEDGKKETIGKTTDNAATLKSYKSDQWNEFVVRAEGNKIVETLNGDVTVEVTDNQVAKRRMKGLIALQLHRRLRGAPV